MPTALGLDNLNSTEIKKNIENGISLVLFFSVLTEIFKSTLKFEKLLSNLSCSGLGDLMNAKSIAVKVLNTNFSTFICVVITELSPKIAVN